MLKLVINEYLELLPTIDYREVEYFQGDLKTLTEENYRKLRSSLKNDGLLMPFAIWENPETNVKYLLDGHQRKKLFMLEKAEPFMIPYFKVTGKNVSEAKQRLLQITSQYGTVTKTGFKNFTFDIPKEWLEDTINFDALNKALKVSFEVKPKEVEPAAEIRSSLTIKCENEEKCQELYERFVKEGLDVRIVK